MKIKMHVACLGLLGLSNLFILTACTQEDQISESSVNEYIDSYPIDALGLHLQPNIKKKFISLNIQNMHDAPVNLSSISINGNQCQLSPELNSEKLVHLETYKTWEGKILGCDFNTIAHVKIMTDKNALEFDF